MLHTLSCCERIQQVTNSWTEAKICLDLLAWMATLRRERSAWTEVMLHRSLLPQITDLRSELAGLSGTNGVDDESSLCSLAHRAASRNTYVSVVGLLHD